MPRRYAAKRRAVAAGIGILFALLVTALAATVCSDDAVDGGPLGLKPDDTSNLFSGGETTATNVTRKRVLVLGPQPRPRAAPPIRTRRQLLRAELGHRARLDRGPRRPRPDLQRSVLLQLSRPRRARPTPVRQRRSRARPAAAPLPARGVPPSLRPRLARRAQGRTSPRSGLRRTTPGPRDPSSRARGPDRHHLRRDRRRVRRRHDLHPAQAELQHRRPHLRPAPR